jgi:hypothetical protein
MRLLWRLGWHGVEGMPTTQNRVPIRSQRMRRMNEPLSGEAGAMLP